MNKFIILLLTFFLILGNVNSSPLVKRHGPFSPCAGDYSNQIDDFSLSPDKLAYGLQVFVTYTGLRKVLITTGAVFEVAVDRSDGVSIVRSILDFCYNSVGLNCPLPPGSSQISLSFPMPLNGPTTANTNTTTTFTYTMALSGLGRMVRTGLANGEYNFQDYKSLSEIEQIGSSNVYKALMKQDDVDIMISMKYIGNKLSTREVVSELKLLRKIQSVNNENISKFYGVTKSENNDKSPLKYMVVLEYGDGGTLREYLQNNSENLHWSIRLKFARQLSRGISFLHENNITYRNLHSNNIIINQQDLKLKTLGITCKMSESSNISTNLQKFLVYIDPQYFSVPSYKSSEDKQATLTKKSDIYSLGILLWELTSGKLPFSSEEHSDLQKEIMEGLREKDIDGIDKAYIDIYKKCWQSEPNDRPEIQELVSALEELDDGIDPSMVQEVKVKPKRKFTITKEKEPPTPVPPVTKPAKPSPIINKTKNPQSNSTPTTPVIPPIPKTTAPVATTPPPPTPTPKAPTKMTPPTPPPPLTKTTTTTTKNKQQSSTLTVPTTRSRSKSPARPRSKSPMKRSISPSSPLTSEITIIEENEEEESESTRINSPVDSEISVSIQCDVILKTQKTPLLTISESPRSLSPRSLSPMKKLPVSQSRPKNISPIGRVISKSPSRKTPTRARSPNFATRQPRQPRTFKRSASVSIPRTTPRILRRTQTMAPIPSPPRSPPRCLSPKKYKPTDRRYSTSFINSSMQINAQSSLAGLWSHSFDRNREDPIKKIIDELLSLFMATYEIDPGHTLLNAIKEFLENQKEETSKIFDWLLTTQLSLQYKILLGYFYLNGIGTSVENRKAFVLFLSAAKKQYAIAQDLLGYCYLNGKGTVKDETLAFEWYQKAVANGSVTAFQSLGECYHNGYGTIKNKSKALQYFKLASDGGNICGKNMFAFCYEMGLGIGLDYKKAFNLYKQAADAGYKLAKQNVAKCYQKGIGVTVDSEAAAYWLEKANQE